MESVGQEWSNIQHRLLELVFFIYTQTRGEIQPYRGRLDSGLDEAVAACFGERVRTDGRLPAQRIASNDDRLPRANKCHEIFSLTGGESPVLL